MAEIIELEIDDDNLTALKRLFVQDCLSSESGETFEAEITEHGDIDRALVASCVNEMIIKILQKRVQAIEND